MDEINATGSTPGMSGSIDQLATALAKAQRAITFATKDRANPHFKSDYATLASVWSACREALASNGLSVTQMPDATDPKTVVVTTILMHASGQWIRSACTVPVSKADAQGVGSAITYARRYSLAAVVGVAPDDDDDGNAASRPAQRAPAAPPPVDVPSKVIVITHGPAKGVSLYDATDADLAEYRSFVQAVLDDPAQTGKRSKAIEILNAIGNEVAARRE